MLHGEVASEIGEEGKSNISSEIDIIGQDQQFEGTNRNIFMRFRAWRLPVKTSAVRMIGFDAGHRVVGHESKCATFHGHRYTAEVYCEAADLDGLGRVIDFGVIKTRVGAWIDEWWDHTMIVWKDDPDLPRLQACIGFKKPFVVDFNPTAENLAQHLLTHVCPAVLAGTGVVVRKIRLWETPNCYVEVEL